MLRLRDWLSNQVGLLGFGETLEDEKTLADGTVLRTHRSFAAKTTGSPGRVKNVLHSQPQVGEDDFWRVLGTGEPVISPASPGQLHAGETPVLLATRARRCGEEGSPWPT